jgi:hypothetical protein
MTIMREYIAKPPDPYTGVSDDAADHSAQIVNAARNPPLLAESEAII